MGALGASVLADPNALGLDAAFPALFLALLWPQLRERRAAEEGRHAVVLRDYLLVTRNIDPVALERGRMATMQQGWTPDRPRWG